MVNIPGAHFYPGHVDRIGRVYDFIHDHLSEDLSVSRLAAVAILSPWHFQRIFRAFSGESPAAFIRRIRIERAANLLLLKPGSTIEAIATESGFGSAELLARHFRQRFQLSPREWRQSPPYFQKSTIRQTSGTNELLQTASGQNSLSPDGYVKASDYGRLISSLRLERRSEKKVIYTRHFNGYDQGIGAAFERLWDWAQPRSLIDASTVKINIGLDNPWITQPERCRSFACFTVRDFPETGAGIGTRIIPAGLYAVVDYSGPYPGLIDLFHEVYHKRLARARVEAVEDSDYMEYHSILPFQPGADFSCSLVIPVRSL